MKKIILIFALLIPFCLDAQIRFKANDVAVAIIYSSSNMAGHISSGVNSDVINAPNVRVVGEAQRGSIPFNMTNNQGYSSTTSNFHNPVTYIAKNWQERINNGQLLPDLRLLSVAKSGEDYEAPNSSRFNPDCATDVNTWNNPVPNFFDADVCMSELLLQQLSALFQEIRNEGKNPVMIGAITQSGASDRFYDLASAKSVENFNNLQSKIKYIAGEYTTYFPIDYRLLGSNHNTDFIIYSYLNKSEKDETLKFIEMNKFYQFYGYEENVELYSDGVHLNSLGQDLLAKSFLSQVLEDFNECDCCP